MSPYCQCNLVHADALKRRHARKRRMGIRPNPSEKKDSHEKDVDDPLIPDPDSCPNRRRLSGRIRRANRRFNQRQRCAGRRLGDFRNGHQYSDRLLLLVRQHRGSGTDHRRTDRRRPVLQSSPRPLTRTITTSCWTSPGRNNPRMPGRSWPRRWKTGRITT